jgi:hypothetical protein
LTTKKLNKWKISTFVLVILLIVMSATSGFDFSLTTGNAVAGDAVDFINTNLLQGQTATLGDVTTTSGVYKASIDIQGQPGEVYITKDGKLMFLQAVPLTPIETTTPTDATPGDVSTADIPKSEKPEVELFIMSHCPYGTQMEKGILPAAKLLGDKIDFKLKFVYYAMHPSQGEVEEQLNQYCIQEEQNDKLLDYLECFLTEGDGEGCLDEIGIDRTALTTCTEAADEEFQITANLEDTSSWLSGKYPLFNTHKTDNEKYGVGGSPTLVLNGATIVSREDRCPSVGECVVAPEVGRDTVSIFAAICGAFTDSPEECNTEFEVGNPSPGFGWGTTGSNNVASCGT